MVYLLPYIACIGNARLRRKAGRAASEEEGGTAGRRCRVPGPPRLRCAADGLRGSGRDSAL